MMQYYKDVDFKALIEQAKINSAKAAEASTLFVEVWNSLVKNTFFTTTKSIIQNDIQKLEKYLLIGSFELTDIMQDCESDFQKIVYNHEHQHKRNKAIIKTLGVVLIEKYSELLDLNSKRTICSYFTIVDTHREIELAEVTVKTQGRVSLFD